MKYHVFIYEGYVSFEIMLATYFLKTKGDVITVGVSKAPVKSCEDFTVLPDVGLEEVTAEEMEILLLPGGNLEPLKDHLPLQVLLRELISRNKVVAGICSAAELVKAANQAARGPEGAEPAIVRNGVEIAGKIVTAPPHKYVDFAIELGRVLSIYKDDDDFEETIRFFKKFEAE